MSSSIKRLELERLWGMPFFDEREDKDGEWDGEAHFLGVMDEVIRLRRKARDLYRLEVEKDDIILLLTDGGLYIICNPIVGKQLTDGGEVVERRNVVMEMLPPRVKEAGDGMGVVCEIFEPRVSVAIPELCGRMSL